LSLDCVQAPQTLLPTIHTLILGLGVAMSEAVYELQESHLLLVQPLTNRRLAVLWPHELGKLLTVPAFLRDGIWGSRWNMGLRQSPWWEC
jgi:hypothetical protein